MHLDVKFKKVTNYYSSQYVDVLTGKWVNGPSVVKHEDGWRPVFSSYGAEAVAGQKTRKTAVIAGLSLQWNRAAEIIEDRILPSRNEHYRAIDKRRLIGGLAMEIHKIIVAETGALKNKNSRWDFIHHMSGKVKDERFRTTEYLITGGWLGVSGSKIYNEGRGLRVMAYDADINARTRLMVAKVNSRIQVLCQEAWSAELESSP